MDTRDRSVGIVRAWLIVTIALVCLATPGCGGCGRSTAVTSKWGGMSKEEWLAQKAKRDQEKAAAAKKAAEEAATKKAADEAKAKQAAEAIRVNPPAASVPSAQPASAPAAAAAPSEVPAAPATGGLPPPLPPSDDLAEWNEHDFYVARLTNDPRLLAAIQARAAQPQRTREEAEALATLLEPRVFANLRNQVNEAVTGEEQKQAQAALIRAVTHALGANGTSKSRTILKQLLEESLPTEDAAVAFDGAVAALVNQHHADSDELVVRLIVLPEQFHKRGPAVVPPHVMRQTAISHARVGGSKDFRTRLARACCEPTASPAAFDAVVPFLHEPSLLNLPAQVLLYQNPRVNDGVRAAIEAQFANASAVAVESLVNLTPVNVYRNPEDVRGTAETAWNDTFSGYLDIKHRQVPNVWASQSLVSLAAATPTDVARARCYRTLDRHWFDGPGIFRSLGYTAGRLADPGLSLTIRALWDENHRAERVTTGAPGRPNPADVERARNRANLESDWFNLTGELARNYCARCYATSVARIAAAHRDGKPIGELAPKPTDLPMPPHPDGGVVDWHHVIWPSGSNPAPAGIATQPFELRYMRLEERTKISRLQGYYRRQLRRVNEIAGPNEVWLSGEGACAPGRVQAIDIFIRRVKTGSQIAPEEEQYMTVEVLSIEIAAINRSKEVAASEYRKN